MDFNESNATEAVLESFSKIKDKSCLLYTSDAADE